VSTAAHTLTPQHIVAELNRHIIGQQDAKKAVAIALRNRWRRKQVEGPLRDEIMPKNILMVGPTGVGKTEIARRLAKLVNAPFIKIEATKFTEVGYVGRDVESIIRDLLDNAVLMTRSTMRKDVEARAAEQAEERILAILVGDMASDETRAKFRELLHEGKLDTREIEIDLLDTPSSSIGNSFEIPGMPGGHMGMINVGEMLQKAIGGTVEKRKKVKLPLVEAYQAALEEESDQLIDQDKVIRAAIDAVENDGIVFLDEIDKIATRGTDSRGGEVSREGVQRDLLPLIEGCTVTTKYGPVDTDHILFIASGAFHIAKPADLLPELQGRLPIRVELKALSEEDMVRILQEPEASILRQYEALLATENVRLNFLEDGVHTIAGLATRINRDVENIGARRLHTMMEKLLEEVSFVASEMSGAVVDIDRAYVDQRVGDFVKQVDLSKFIL
jgi:ATP-dependent HslUV protease ATP-binding subunit HslU